MRRKSRAGQGSRRDIWPTWQAGMAGHSGWAAECLLRQYGIAVLGRRYAYSADDSYGVRVSGAQAEWAEYLLCAGGFVLNSPLLNPRHANIKREAMPPSWGKPARPSGLSGWYHRLVGLMLSGDTTDGMKTKSAK